MLKRTLFAGVAAAADDGDDAAHQQQPGKKRKLGNGSRSLAGERSAVYHAAADVPDGRVLRPEVALRSRAFAGMKGHTSYLTFARRARGPALQPGEVGDGAGEEAGATCAMM